MKIRFQADADIDPAIRRGALRREPAAGVYPDGTSNPEVLRVAAEQGRVLVTGDLRTMSAHFHEYIAHHESQGVLLIPSSRSIGAAIEGLLFIWTNATPEDFRNRVQWLP